MILEFKVSNYMSIRKELKLSFIATSLKESTSETSEIIPLSDTGSSLLRSAVIYGANGSGKSNLLKAIEFYKEFIIGSFKNSQACERINVENFRLNVTSIKEPTMMEAIFCDSEFIYRYGFELTDKAVNAEWLFQRYNKKYAKEIELFKRKDNEISVHPKCELIKELVTKRMVRNNALILSTAAQFNDITSVKILTWLNDTEVLFCSKTNFLWEQVIRHLDDESMRQRIIDFAKYADLGIESISKIDNHIISNHRQYDNDGKEVNNISFTFSRNESEGTIKFFSLSYPIIKALDNGSRLIIDELDARLHPLLVQKIVSLFNSAKTNPKGAQLLFTTHDSFLLSASLFRRDQVLFIQKDQWGETTSCSITDYKVRTSTPFERDYLQGRYGAIPRIGSIDNF